MNCIFDLDGTVLDTLDDLAASTNYALRAFGLPERSRDEVRRFVGNGVRRLMQQAVPDGESDPRFEEVLATFREHYMHHSMDTTQPYPGIMPMLARLREEGHATAVVSNKFDAATKSLCQHYFGTLIDVAIGESERIRRKPAPDTVIEAMRLLGAKKEQSIYIGDSDVDIATAKACAIPCVSVLWGFRDRDFLLAHGATVFISQPEEMVKMVSEVETIIRQ